MFNRRIWYSRARPKRLTSSILVEKSPPFLLIPDQLAANFRDSRFCIMVRHPLATLEGILRSREGMKNPDDRDLRVVAAQHIGRCLEQQVANIRNLGDRAVSLTYESMCAEPLSTATLVQTLCPELDDLNFDLAISVKGRYNERLRNFNDEQVARLDHETLRIARQELQPFAGSLEYFGYIL